MRIQLTVNVEPKLSHLLPYVNERLAFVRYLFLNFFLCYYIFTSIALFFHCTFAYCCQSWTEEDIKLEALQNNLFMNLKYSYIHFIIDTVLVKVIYAYINTKPTKGKE